jgi:hypothetical protein
VAETLGATLTSYAAKWEGQKEVANFGVIKIVCIGKNILLNHGIM